MKQFVARNLAKIGATIAAVALVFGWVAVAGALPGVVTQPVGRIAELIDPTSTSVDPEPTSTTTSDETTTSTSVDETTTTSVEEPTTTSSVPAEENGPSDKNCGRYQAGPECARPVTPGYDRDHGNSGGPSAHSDAHRQDGHGHGGRPHVDGHDDQGDDD